ncbi:hypothetical protein ACLOJK_031997 [Asimina triloba]
MTVATSFSQNTLDFLINYVIATSAVHRNSGEIDGGVLRRLRRSDGDHCPLLAAQSALRSGHLKKPKMRNGRRSQGPSAEAGALSARSSWSATFNGSGSLTSNETRVEFRCISIVYSSSATKEGSEEGREAEGLVVSGKVEGCRSRSGADDPTTNGAWDRFITRYALSSLGILCTSGLSLEGFRCMIFQEVSGKMRAEMTEHIQKLRICFQKLGKGYLLEQGKLRDMLKSMENKCNELGMLSSDFVIVLHLIDLGSH